MGNSNGSISNTFYRTFGIQYLFVNTGKRTKHSSKGLGYDDVIVINGKNETYGFPTKVEDDPVLSLVIKGDRSIDYAEERRLFYVAMTRTKNRVFFVAPEANPVLYGELDLNDVVFNIVKAWQNVSRIKFYGMTVFCEVLCGEENKRIQDNKLDKIPEYGIYKTLSGDAVRTVVDWMISEHYILKTKGKYPVLHSTYEGLHYSESITEGKLKKLKKQLEGNKIPFDM